MTMLEARAVQQLGTILGVWAHPDDETYLSGGLMAIAAAAGQRVVCVTATRGERGGPDGAAPEVVAQVRDDELAAALDALGVREHHQLGYPDGGCAAIDPARAGAAVTERLAAGRPDTIVTFAEDGMTGHPDHRAVHRWATAAWRATGGRARLLCATTPPGFAERHAAIHEALGAFDPGLPRPTPLEELDLRIPLDEVTLATKMRALRSHASQVEPVERIIGSDALTQWWAEEYFTDAGARRSPVVTWSGREHAAAASSRRSVLSSTSPTSAS
jgi:LmbE family N-acetylglucosaminyl deacetylase